MQTPSRTLILVLFALLALVAAAFALSHWSADFPGTIIMGDHDLSESPLGWMIAIPLLFLAAILVAAVCAGAAVMVVLALAFAALMVVLALLLAAMPFAVFLGIPVLAVYGLVKLVQRDRRMAQAA